jgi:Cys-rich repeat protein
MDDQRFDSLTKGLARGRSRRDVLKLFAGGAAGGVLAVRALEEASAQAYCTSDAECGSGMTCQANYCAAAPAPAPATTTDTSTAAVMPATGSGPAPADTTPWLGVALAGGAAAWLAGRGLRKGAPAPEE